jgi:hypothetical protein
VTALLAGLLSPSAKKRMTAEEALARLRAPEEESTRRAFVRDDSSSNTQVPPTPSSWHADMFSKSPRANSFFSTPGGLRHHSRYRTDFEEVEFLVS